MSRSTIYKYVPELTKRRRSRVLELTSRTWQIAVDQDLPAGPDPFGVSCRAGIRVRVARLWPSHDERLRG